MSDDKVRYRSKPFKALVEGVAAAILEWEAVVWDDDMNCGIGLFPKGENAGRVWGPAYPRDLITSWRGTEILCCLNVIEIGTLSAAYFTGMRNPDSSDVERHVEPMIARIGRTKYDEIMSLPVPEEIIRAILDGQHSNLKPALRPITDEVRAGTIVWRQEFADAGIEHPDDVDAKQREADETIYRFESLLTSYAKSQGLPRICFGMGDIEGAVLALVEKGAEKQHISEVIVALAGVAGGLATYELVSLVMLFLPSPQDFQEAKGQEKEKELDKAARWLASVRKHPWYRLRKRPGTFTFQEARDLLQQLLEQYFPTEPSEQPQTEEEVNIG